MSDAAKEIAELRARVKDLVAALWETQTVTAACMRVITLLGADAIDMVERELEAVGVKKGFGPRATALLSEDEPKPKE